MTATAAPERAPRRASHAFRPAALRAARHATGLSLTAAGDLIGRAGSIVARYERGYIDPPASVLVALAAAYGVHPGEFFAQHHP